MALIFLGAPSWPKMALNPKKGLKIDLISIFTHEGGTQKAVAQNEAIQIRFQMI